MDDSGKRIRRDVFDKTPIRQNIPSAKLPFDEFGEMYRNRIKWSLAHDKYNCILHQVYLFNIYFNENETKWVIINFLYILERVVINSRNNWLYKLESGMRVCELHKYYKQLLMNFSIKSCFIQSIFL